MLMRFKPAALFLVFITALACASAQRAEKREALPLARMVRPGIMDVSRPTGRTPSEVDITYEIQIRADGSPDFSTLKIMGKGSSEIRNSLVEWIGASTFEAARKNGIAVTSLFKGGLRSSVRRM
jgi:hypothetical protein